MKKLAAIGVLLGFAAFAASRAQETAGNVPTESTDGVSLGVAQGCRCSIRVPDAGSNVIGADGLAPAGYIVPMYFDPSLPVWVESARAIATSCPIQAKLDGGRIRQYVCPDFEPLTATGRVSCMKYGVIGYDGGTGQDWIADGGVGPAVVVRTECWGPSVVGP